MVQFHEGVLCKLHMEVCGMTKVEFVDVIIKAVLEANPEQDEQEVEALARTLADQAEENSYSYELNCLIVGKQVL